MIKFFKIIRHTCTAGGRTNRHTEASSRLPAQSTIVVFCWQTKHVHERFGHSNCVRVRETTPYCDGVWHWQSGDKQRHQNTNYTEERTVRLSRGRSKKKERKSVLQLLLSMWTW